VRESDGMENLQLCIEMRSHLVRLRGHRRILQVPRALAIHEPFPRYVVDCP
jgi:hypothetical protein